MVMLSRPDGGNEPNGRRLDGAMTMRLKSLFTHVCTPDALDMIDHYQTRAERLADLWVHVTGLSLAGVGGIVLAGAGGDLWRAGHRRGDGDLCGLSDRHAVGLDHLQLDQSLRRAARAEADGRGGHLPDDRRFLHPVHDPEVRRRCGR
jgi:hypothetical protein